MSLRAVQALCLIVPTIACAPAVQQGAHDFSKAIEKGAYDRAASLVSRVCADVHHRGLWIQRTRIEARREIRQSQFGRFGPKPPKNLAPALAEKIGKNTLNGTGPIVLIYCENDVVPDHVWEQLARGWRD